MTLVSCGQGGGLKGKSHWFHVGRVRGWRVNDTGFM